MERSDKTVDISIVLPSMNEGSNVSKVLDEIISVMSGLKDYTYELIAIDTPSSNPSYDTFAQYASKHSNFIAIQLDQNRPVGNDKSVKYMLGFKLARGRYIVQMDSDGQDNPADLPKFIEKLEEGYDLVIGHKQNRKDGKLYMLSSKISNTLTRLSTGIHIHDMNCGFKGYPAHVAKSLNIRGRWYRFIPAILSSMGYKKITEVPIENRKRVWGATNFSFRNRLEGGVFDYLNVLIVNYMGSAPTYFFGWISVLTGAMGFLLLTLSLLLLDDTTYKIIGTLAGLSIFQFALLVVIIGVTYDHYRAHAPVDLERVGILHSTNL